MLRVILAVVGTAAGLVLLLSFKTHSPNAAATPPAAIGRATSPDSPSAIPPSSSPDRSSAATSSPSNSAGTGSAGASKQVTGEAASTIYGPVQVQITVKNGKVTAAQAVEYPEATPHDEQINAYAIPQLNAETVAASSARIDAVSGATYTSNGYIASLQNALDKAGL